MEREEETVRYVVACKFYYFDLFVARNFCRFSSFLRYTDMLLNITLLFLCVARPLWSIHGRQITLPNEMANAKKETNGGGTTFWFSIP